MTAHFPAWHKQSAEENVENMRARENLREILMSATSACVHFEEGIVGFPIIAFCRR